MTSLITRYVVYDPALSECGDGRITTMDPLQSVSWQQSTSLLALQTSSKPQPISVNTADSVVQKNAASESSLWKQHASLKSAETNNWESLSLEKSVLALQHLPDSPSVDNYLCILKKCRKSKSLAHAMFVHVHLCSHGVDTHSVLESHAVSLFVDCESIRHAQSAFNRLNRRSEFVWTCLLQGYVNSGEPQLALDLVQVMKDGGIALSKFTFVALLKACAKLQLLERGLVKEGQMVFESMRKDFGIIPTLEHLNCLVDLLGRVGRLNEAVLMLNQSSISPDPVMWGTVLGACRKWHDMQIARHAFDCAIALDSSYTTAYSLMANIYADAGLWEEVKMIEAMKAKKG
ncbi:hypothetical protein L7F22_006609 [Adiantum nelumboides]|nr:hypothetical protein [Adiantum nelumboides]